MPHHEGGTGMASDKAAKANQEVQNLLSFKDYLENHL